jgi:hypothetical protein
LGAGTPAFNNFSGIDRPKLSPEDIKKLQAAGRNNKVSEWGHTHIHNLCPLAALQQETTVEK